ncbi:MAG: hypothetical protein ACK506_18935 [Pirellula sp.]
MLVWENVKPSHRLKVWAAIAIRAASNEVDNVRPGGMAATIAAVHEDMLEGTTIDLGYFRDEPVAVVSYDCSLVTVHVLEHVRKHQLEQVALNYAVNQARANGYYTFGLFCENEELYKFALQMGFQRPGDEDDYRDELLWFESEKDEVRI